MLCSLTMIFLRGCNLNSLPPGTREQDNKILFPVGRELLHANFFSHAGALESTMRVSSLWAIYFQTSLAHCGWSNSGFNRPKFRIH